MDQLILSVDQKTQYCKNVNFPQIGLHIFDASQSYLSRDSVEF